MFLQVIKEKNNNNRSLTAIIEMRIYGKIVL